MALISSGETLAGAANRSAKVTRSAIRLMVRKDGEMGLRRLMDIRLGNGVRVSRIEDESTGLTHVVKEVVVADTNGYHARQLRSEYEQFRGLEHPNLLPALGMRQGGQVLIYADAQCNLEQYLARKGRLPPGLVANLLEQVGQALEHLHSSGFCHGHLGPTSVFISPDGQAHLGDFLAHRLGGKDPMPDPDPMPRYQAPECNDAAFGMVSPSSDIYSLGYLALEALTGQGFAGLFAQGEQGDTLAWHLDPVRCLRDLHASLPGVPKPLIDLIQGMIAKSPPLRKIRSCGEMLDLLEKRKLLLPLVFPAYVEEKAGQATSAPKATTATALPRMLVLNPVGGTQGRTQIFVPGRPLLIGNQPGCDWVPGGTGIAGRHGVLMAWPDGGWQLVDLKGKGDCGVNDIREPMMSIRKGDVLRIGGGTYLAELAEPLDGSRRIFGINVYRQMSKNHEGVTLLGNWEKRNQAAILHVFPSVFSDDEAWVRKFLQDGAKLGKLGAKTVLPLFEAGRRIISGNKVVWYLIRDYCPLGNMKERIQDGEKVPPRRLARYAGSGCKALSDASRAGIIHGCLHPGSLYFDAADRMRMAFVPLPLDGKIVYRNEAGKSIPASYAHYRAPELFGTGQPGNLQTDIYALAACFLHLITGKLPFDAKSGDLAGVKKLKETELKTIDGLPPEYPREQTLEIFRQALHPDPAKRFKTPGRFGLNLMMAFSPDMFDTKSPTWKMIPHDN